MIRPKLDSIEKSIIKDFTSEELSFLAEVVENRNFKCMINLISRLAEIEKNYFLGLNEENPTKLWGAFLYMKGSVDKLDAILRVFYNIKHELATRKGEE